MVSLGSKPTWLDILGMAQFGLAQARLNIKELFGSVEIGPGILKART